MSDTKSKMMISNGSGFLKAKRTMTDFAPDEESEEEID